MGEIQFSGRTVGVMWMISKIRVRVAIWVGEMRFSGRTGGGMGSAVLDSRPR